MARLPLLVLFFVTSLFQGFHNASAFGQIEQIWLTHRANDPSRLVVNWMTQKPGDSTVHYGRTKQYAHHIHIEEIKMLHHVEIPLAEKGGVYHYSVCTGKQRSEDATFKTYPTDVLRVAIAGDWQRKPDLSAIIKDDVHLLLTAGDNVVNLYQSCGAGNNHCIKAYIELVKHYPALFRSIPFMPVLGNHDKQIHPRGKKPPEYPVYDTDCTAYRRFFELPNEEWKWYFDVPDFDIRLIALDLNHIRDIGTTWQTCHRYHKGSEQFEWYRKLMESPSQQFVVTVYNANNADLRHREQGAWHKMLSKGTIAVTGSGYYAERAEVDGFTYYNTSLNGTGDVYPDSKMSFIQSKDNYILLTISKKPPKMIVELKSLRGLVLDRKSYSGKQGNTP